MIVNLLLIVGCQWGDEGKGKIVDILAEEADLVARYQGGNNAGHTVVIGDKKYILHTIPSGILHEGVKCLIGNGVVIDPISLDKEVEGLRAVGISVGENLMISENAHLIMPYHIELDKMQEKMRGDSKIGTTGRGIGCCYGDKITRQGIRVCDVKNKDIFIKKFKKNMNNLLPQFKNFYETLPFNPIELEEKAWTYSEKLQPYIVDGITVVNRYLDNGKKVLCEGAQGIMLDIDFGTYPYVTSSNPSPGGVCTGLGVPPNKITKVIGIVKAYTTRVGSGVLPTELLDEDGEKLRKIGGEYGATTGRPRRCGWFDAPAVRRTVQISGAKHIILTKLDVLSTFPKIKICGAYRFNNKTYNLYPLGIDQENSFEPIYDEVAGWDESLDNITSFEQLPKNAISYVEKIEDMLDVRVSAVSVGPRRDQMIFRDKDLYNK